MEWYLGVGHLIIHDSLLYSERSSTYPNTNHHLVLLLVYMA